MRPQPSPEPIWTHIAAAFVALAFISIVARLLLQIPELATNRRETRIQLRWLVPVGSPPAAAVVAAPVHVVEPPQPPPAAAVANTTMAAPPPMPGAAAPTPVTPSLPTAVTPARALRLYGKDGQPLVPDAPADKANSAVEQVFEHRDELATGVGERPMEKTVTKMFEDSRKQQSPYQTAARVVHGKDVQHAQARRPPPVAFNPNLHERKSDLGSEATGDAYKAAPIRFEKAPGLKGEASRRIRVAVGELEQRYPRCSAEQRERWMAPVQSNLDALQRVEYRFNNGADPVEAEHSLLSAADSAYDQARRALWDAERRMQACR